MPKTVGGEASGRNEVGGEKREKGREKIEGEGRLKRRAERGRGRL